MSTSVRGIYACGDMVSYPGKDKRIVTGCGEAVTAVMSVYKYPQASRTGRERRRSGAKHRASQSGTPARGLETRRVPYPTSPRSSERPPLSPRRHRSPCLRDRAFRRRHPERDAAWRIGSGAGFLCGTESPPRTTAKNGRSPATAQGLDRGVPAFGSSRPRASTRPGRAIASQTPG